MRGAFGADRESVRNRAIEEARQFAQQRIEGIKRAQQEDQRLRDLGQRGSLVRPGEEANYIIVNGQRQELGGPSPVPQQTSPLSQSVPRLNAQQAATATSPPVVSPQPPPATPSRPAVELVPPPPPLSLRDIAERGPEIELRPEKKLLEQRDRIKRLAMAGVSA